jgi:hypothetical protein
MHILQDNHNYSEMDDTGKKNTCAKMAGHESKQQRKLIKKQV